MVTLFVKSVNLYYPKKYFKSFIFFPECSITRILCCSDSTCTCMFLAFEILESFVSPYTEILIYLKIPVTSFIHGSVFFNYHIMM